MDKYYVTLWVSAPDPSAFVARALIEWLFFPLRILAEALFGSPADIIIGVDPIDV